LITAKGAQVAKFRKGFSLALLCDLFALFVSLAVGIAFRNRNYLVIRRSGEKITSNQQREVATC